MLKKLMIGLAAAAALTGAAAAPAFAYIPVCMEAPNPDTCPYGGSPKVTNQQHHHLFFGRFDRRHHEMPIKKG